ncbi:MAG TPA: cyclic nucleotide-binding domain-containing protein [Alphaproteobacteria bacterium]|nr:cyclic nucleotide-binding domain-containing protein [Alphaproteobacteria bacterium]
MRTLTVQNRRVEAPSTPEVVTFPAGTSIFEEGRRGRRAFIVRSGLVELSKDSDSGEVVIGYAGAGEIFGEMVPLDSQPRMASARAVRDTECVVVSRDLLSKKLGRSDPFVRDLLFVLLRGLRSVTDDYIDLRSQVQEQIMAAQEMRHEAPGKVRAKRRRRCGAKTFKPMHIKARRLSTKG